MAMNNPGVRCCLWLCAMFACFQSSTTLALNEHIPSNDVAKLKQQPNLNVTFAYQEAPEHLTSFDNPKIPDIAQTVGWKTSDQPVNLGINNTPYWYLVRLKNSSDNNMGFVFQVAHSQLDNLIVLEVEGHGITRNLEMGDHLPFPQRLIHIPYFALDVELAPKEEKQIWLYVQTEGAHQVPIEIWQSNAFVNHTVNETTAHIFYYGILSGLVVLNLFIFFKLRESSYLYYCCSVLGFMLWFATDKGHGFQHIWSASAELQSLLLQASLPTFLMFSVLFAREFLKLKVNNPVLSKVLLVLIYLEVGHYLSILVLPYNQFLVLSSLLALIVSACLALVGPIEWFRGNRIAKYYTFAWGCLIVSMLYTASYKLGWFDYNFFGEFGMQMGSALEALLLTLALAERLNSERRSKEDAMLYALQAAREREQAEAELKTQALHHAVTKLPNRTVFRTAIEQRIRDMKAQSSTKKLYVSAIRVCNWDAIVKTLGYQYADEAIKEFAAKLNKLVSAYPEAQVIETIENCPYYVCNIDDNSFGLFFELDDIAAKEYRKSFLEVRSILQEPFELEGFSLDMNPRFSISIYPENSRNAELLIKQALVAHEHILQEATDIAFYSENFDRYNTRSLSLMSELNEAIINNELYLAYQPKIALPKEELRGVEVLLRWEHREHGFIPPDDFIPIAEQTGIIRKLTQWVVANSIAELKPLVDSNQLDSIAINISASNLVEPGFIPGLVNECKKQNFSPEKLTLELTETSMMQNPEMSLEVLEALVEKGFKISVDDFGTGYSSLSYIQRIPATEIKIDRSLTAQMCENSDDQIIVKTTTEMCQSLGLEVVVEGVENQATLDALKQYGCNFAQGYYILRPAKLDDLIKWLNDDRLVEIEE